MAKQLNIFEEQQRAKNLAYREWFYRGCKERSEQKRKEREANNVAIYVDMQAIAVRPLSINDLKFNNNRLKLLKK